MKSVITVNQNDPHNGFVCQINALFIESLQCLIFLLLYALQISLTEKYINKKKVWPASGPDDFLSVFTRSANPFSHTFPSGDVFYQLVFLERFLEAIYINYISV